MRSSILTVDSLTRRNTPVLIYLSNNPPIAYLNQPEQLHHLFGLGRNFVDSTNSNDKHKTLSLFREQNTIAASLPLLLNFLSLNLTHYKHYPRITSWYSFTYCSARFTYSWRSFSFLYHVKQATLTYILLEKGVGNHLRPKSCITLFL